MYKYFYKVLDLFRFVCYNVKSVPTRVRTREIMQGELCIILRLKNCFLENRLSC